VSISSIVKVVTSVTQRYLRSYVTRFQCTRCLNHCVSVPSRTERWRDNRSVHAVWVSSLFSTSEI